jgi:uncharacterized protein (TIGR00730 family)
MTLSLCVYCGSRDGLDPAHRAAALEVGRQIGVRGWQLVYGGGHTGLMGAVADAAIEHGAKVIGVIPEKLMTREIGHTGVTDLQVVGSMHERKHAMAMQSDAFIALPGGIGTMEEIFEVWTWRQLGYHRKALALLNVAGYYDDLLQFIERSQSSGFLWPDVKNLLLVDTDISALLDRIEDEHARLQVQTPPDLAVPGHGGVSDDI